MRPTDPQPVKLFIAALFSDEKLLEQAFEECRQLFGSIDYRSERFLFDVTDYYEPEMGTPIYRQFVSFLNLISPGKLAEFKIRTNAIEDSLADHNQRKVNLDTGYMDYHKVVLASAKYNGQKIYLDHGIYADPTLYYRKGQFHPYDWSFPDFKSKDRYYQSLLEIRRRYKEQLKSLE